jgi:cell division protein FtsA
LVCVCYALARSGDGTRSKPASSISRSHPRPTFRRSITSRVDGERKRPDSSVTHSELERLLEEIEADAAAEAQRTITWETGLSNVDVRLVHAGVASAGIDGYAVSNPVGFQGRHLRITVFNAYAPLVHLGALESVVEQLGLKLIKVVAEPYAVARSISAEQAGQSGALFIDVGGGTTDVALVRTGSVEGTRMFALGGRAFTKSLADRLDMSFEDAEQVKLDHAEGRAVDDASEVAAIIGEDVAVWAAGVELVLEEFGQSGLLPGRIELCGGGAALPQIKAALEADGFASDLPFARRPQVSLMEPGSVSEVRDATGLLLDQQDVTPMALAFQAVEASREQEPLDAALQRVLRGMRV